MRRFSISNALIFFFRILVSRKCIGLFKPLIKRVNEWMITGCRTCLWSLLCYHAITGSWWNSSVPEELFKKSLPAGSRKGWRLHRWWGKRARLFRPSCLRNSGPWIFPADPIRSVAGSFPAAPTLVAMQSVGRLPALAVLVLYFSNQRPGNYKIHLCR